MTIGDGIAVGLAALAFAGVICAVVSSTQWMARSSIRRSSRPATAEEVEAFDEAFEHMDRAFRALDKGFRHDL